MVDRILDRRTVDILKEDYRISYWTGRQNIGQDDRILDMKNLCIRQESG
jgi:hypothetical protein